MKKLVSRRNIIVVEKDIHNIFFFILINIYYGYDIFHVIDSKSIYYRKYAVMYSA